MTVEAIITVRVTASQAAHSLRDASSDNIASVSDLYGIKAISSEMDAGVKSAENKLSSAAKKLGLSTGKEVSYGMRGAKDGPIEFWYQATAR